VPAVATNETLTSRLLDLDEVRFSAMDDGGVDLPFSLIRAQDGLSPAVTGLEKSVSDYFLEHFVVTTSGYFTAPPLRCALDVLGVDRVLYSVDYPYRANTAGAELLRTAPVAPTDLRMIASGNAERVLKLG
jgi:uncharacterized protein